MLRVLLYLALVCSTSTTTAKELNLIQFVQLVQSDSFEGQLQANESTLTELSYQQQLDALKFNLTPNIGFSRDAGRKTSKVGFRLQQPVNSTITTYLNGDYTERELLSGNQSYTTNLDLGVSVSLIRTFSQAYRNKTEIGATLNKQIAKLAEQQNQRQLLFTAYSSYVQHQQLLELFRLSEEATQRSEKNYASANARFLMGQVAKSDVFRAQTALNQAKLNQSSYQNSLISSQLSLEQLANQPVLVSKEQNITTYTFKKPAFALEAVPDVSAQQLAVKVASQSLKEAKEETLPDLTLSAEYRQVTQSGISNNVDLGLSDNSDYDEVNFGVSVENSFNARSRNSDYQRAQIELKNAQIELKIKEHQVLNRIDELQRDIKFQKELVESYQQTISLAEAALTLLNRRYEKGMISNIEVLDSEAELVRAKTNYRSAVTEHNLAIINYYYYIGMLDIELLASLEQNTRSNGVN